MRSILFFCSTLILFSFSSVFSQNFKFQLPPGYNKILAGDEIPGKEGNLYLNEAWMPGSVILKNGIKINGLKYRYCVYNKEMQFQFENACYLIGAPDSIEKIIIGNKIFIYSSLLKNNNLEKDYFEVIIDGRVKLLARYVTEVIHSNYNVALSTGSKNDKINIKEQYYLQKSGLDALLIDKKGKSVELSFSDKMKEMKEYLDKEKISYKKEKNLIALVQYYNSLN